MADKKLNKTYSSFTNDKVVNRAEQIRRDDDIVKTPTVTIYDCDNAILSYLQDEVKPKLIENSQTIDVPVLFASGEKWVQVQKRGFMRDEKGKLMTPLISIRRSAVTERDTLKSLGVNQNPSGMGLVHYNKFTKVNKYDKFNVLQGTRPTRELFISPIPEYVDISYELMLWTQYTEQMNSLVEQLVPLSGFAWGTTWKFISFLQDVSFETINSTGEDRLIRATIPLTTKGILLAESELRKSNIQKQFAVKKITFANETETFSVDLENEPPGGYPGTVPPKPAGQLDFERPQGDIDKTSNTGQGPSIRTIKGIQDLNDREHE